MGSSSGNSSGAAKAAEGEAIIKSRYSSAQIEQELEKLARQNRVLYSAAVKYIEAEDAYDSARADAAPSRTPNRAGGEIGARSVNLATGLEA